jgi:hypothetical protein
MQTCSKGTVMGSPSNMTSALVDPKGEGFEIANSGAGHGCLISRGVPTVQA